MTNSEWASQAPWAEVVARSRGRAKYNSIRKLRAGLRRLAIVRRLRHVGDIHQRGLQRQLAAVYVPSTSIKVTFTVCDPSAPARCQPLMAPGPVAGPVSAP